MSLYFHIDILMLDPSNEWSSSKNDNYEKNHLQNIKEENNNIKQFKFDDLINVILVKDFPEEVEPMCKQSKIITQKNFEEIIEKQNLNKNKKPPF